MRKLCLFLMLMAPLLSAPTCGTGSKTKKLIEIGWDEPDPAFMRAHLAQLEASPFDGCVYHLSYPGPDGKPLTSFTREGRPLTFAWDAWGTRRFREDELRAGLLDLQATPFKRFRSNFLRINVTPGRLDWFDDHGAVLSNLRLGASIARRGGSAGVMLDTEAYEGQLFEYAAQRDTSTRSYQEYAAQVRRRGAEVMRALEQGYPGLTVFLTLSATWPYLVWMGDRIPVEKQRYGLLVPFVDGMITGASDSAKIVDGMEASYHIRDPAMLDPYLRAQTEVLPWLSDSTKYRRIVSLAFGFWLDFDTPNRPWHVAEPDSNYRPPAELRQVVKRALEMSDEYVWVNSQTPRWWTAEGTRKDLPDDYVRALRDARRGLAR